MGVLEKISEIEKEIARTQKNKGVVVRLAKYNVSELLLVTRQNDNHSPGP